jgi:hypothetical protein
MRKTWIAAAALAVVMAGYVAALGGVGLEKVKDAGKGAAPEAPLKKLIVHEWGTFTNFSGSDGVYLDYRPLVGSDLPSFVFDRKKQTTLSQKMQLSEKFSLITKSRMETPVTYFYTDEPMAVNVRVDFPQGILTEFYPPARTMNPLVKPDEKVPPVGKSFLDWGQIGLFPQDQIEPQRVRIPEVKDGDHYAAARETDSDVVWFSDRNVGNYMEKFLFYRGAGNFEMPVKMQSIGNDRFAIANNGPEAIRAAFLVQIEGAKVRLAHLTNISGEITAALPPETTTIDSLAEAMVQDLMDEGLYVKEARAMVKTWKSSWFGEDGTRLLYLVPRAQTDVVLPLRVRPAPTEMVRVMVGRLEVMTPETESRLQRLIGLLGADDGRVRDDASRQIRAMGRFAEPALLHVSKSEQDPERQARAQALLGKLRQEQQK